MSSNEKRSKSKLILLAKQYLLKTACRLAFLTLLLSTFSYHARLQNFTIRPIQAISWDVDNPDLLRVALEHFRMKKRKELDFVRPAVRLLKVFASRTATDMFIEHAICGCGHWSLLLAKRGRYLLGRPSVLVLESVVLGLLPDQLND